MLIVAAAVTVAGLLMVAGQPVIAAIMFVAGLAVAAFAYLKTPAPRIDDQVLRSEPDYALVGSALGLSNDPIALTSGEGSLLIVNSAYRERFGGAPPPLEVAASDEARQGLKLAQTMAWRDGAGCVAAIETSSGTMPVEVERVGAHSDLLAWRFIKSAAPDPISVATNRLQGRAGELLSQAGLLAAFVDPHGKVIAHNRLFEERALSRSARDEMPRLEEFVQKRTAATSA